GDELHYKLDKRMVSGRFYKKDGSVRFEYYDSLERDYKSITKDEFQRVEWLDESEDSEAVEFAEWIQRNSWLEGKEPGVWYKWHGMECDEGNPKTTKQLYQIFKSQS